MKLTNLGYAWEINEDHEIVLYSAYSEAPIYLTKQDLEEMLKVIPEEISEEEAERILEEIWEKNV